MGDEGGGRGLKDTTNNILLAFKFELTQEYSATVPLKCKLTVSQSSILETRFSILDSQKLRGSSQVSRRSRPFENLSSRVSRLSSEKNKGLFAQLTFDTTEYFFTGRSILISGP